MTIDFDIYTHIGSREKNEDCVGVIVNGNYHCFFVADGLGKHGNGDVASNCVREYLEFICKTPAIEEDNFFDKAFNGIQSLIAARQLQDENCRKMKTTAVISLFKDEQASWAYIGDSRLYHFRNGKLISRTLDHSVPQMLALANLIHEEDIATHPDRSRLLRALGAEDSESYSHELGQKNLCLVAGDVFLLCSDGFWEALDTDMLQNNLAQDLTAAELLKLTAQQVSDAQREVEQADNRSAVLIKITG